MVCLVDNKQIPSCLTGLSSALGVGGEEVEGTNNKLAVEKGVVPVEFQRGAAVFVKNAEGQLESAEHFDEPLVEQGGRQQDEDAPGAAGEVEALQDETGLDGFPQSDLIGEKDTGNDARSDFGGDGELVGNQIDASSGESPDWALAHVAAALEALDAKAEPLELIDLSGEKTLLGF